MTVSGDVGIVVVSVFLAFVVCDSLYCCWYCPVLVVYSWNIDGWAHPGNQVVQATTITGMLYILCWLVRPILLLAWKTTWVSPPRTTSGEPTKRITTARCSRRRKWSSRPLFMVWLCDDSSQCRTVVLSADHAGCHRNSRSPEPQRATRVWNEQWRDGLSLHVCWSSPFYQSSYPFSLFSDYCFLIFLPILYPLMTHLLSNTTIYTLFVLLYALGWFLQPFASLLNSADPIVRSLLCCWMCRFAGMLRSFRMPGVCQHESSASHILFALFPLWLFLSFHYGLLCVVGQQLSSGLPSQIECDSRSSRWFGQIHCMASPDGEMW